VSGSSTSKLSASILTDLQTHHHISQEAPDDSDQQIDKPMDHIVSQEVPDDPDQPMALHQSLSEPTEDDTHAFNAPSIVQENVTLDRNLQSLEDISKLVELPNFIPIPRQRFFWEIFQDRIFL